MNWACTGEVCGLNISGLLVLNVMGSSMSYLKNLHCLGSCWHLGIRVAPRGWLVDAMVTAWGGGALSVT